MPRPLVVLFLGAAAALVVVRQTAGLNSSSGTGQQMDPPAMPTSAGRAMGPGGAAPGGTGPTGAPGTGSSPTGSSRAGSSHPGSSHSGVATSSVMPSLPGALTSSAVRSPGATRSTATHPPVRSSAPARQAPVAATASIPAEITALGPPVGSRWGPVQVRIVVANGHIVGASATVSPQAGSLSAEISSLALPVLNAEVLRVQSARIDAVAGATATSIAYRSSLQSAIDRAFGR